MQKPENAQRLAQMTAQQYLTLEGHTSSRHECI